MPSDPSFGTTGFFSYLWVRRKPVFDSDETVVLTDDTNLIELRSDQGSAATSHFFELREDGGEELREDGSQEELEAPFMDGPILVNDSPGELVRWI